MKQTLCLFAIHQIATSLQPTYNLNPRTRRYPTLGESTQMKSVYFTIHPGKNPPPQNGCQLKPPFFSFFFQKHRFHILHFPNSTRLFTKPTGRHYTKHQFSPDIASNASKKGRKPPPPPPWPLDLQQQKDYSSTVRRVWKSINSTLPLFWWVSINNKCKCRRWFCVLWFACVPAKSPPGLWQSPWRPASPSLSHSPSSSSSFPGCGATHPVDYRSPDCLLAWLGLVCGPMGDMYNVVLFGSFVMFSYVDQLHLHNQYPWAAFVSLRR